MILLDKGSAAEKSRVQVGIWPPRSWSLKVVVPLLAVLLFLVVQGMTFFSDRYFFRTQLIDDSLKHVETLSYHIQQSLADHLMKGRIDVAERELTLIALNEQTTTLMVMDENSIIQLSDQMAHKHYFASSVLSDFDPDKFSLASKNETLSIEYEPDALRIVAYVPLRLGHKEDSLSNKENGAIYLAYSLERTLEQYFADLWQKKLIESSFLAIALLLFTWLLNKMLVKPLNRLANESRRVRFLQRFSQYHSGQGEIGVLEDAFREMSQGIKHSFEQLKMSEQRWQFALSGAGDGVWDWEPLKNRAYFSPRWKEMLGYSEKEIGDSLDEWYNRVHPEDKDKVLSIIDSQNSLTRSAFEVVHRVRRSSDLYMWVMVRGMVVERTVDGFPSRIIGTQTDITDFREAQDRIRHQALHDDVTGLANRRNLLERIRIEMDSAKEANRFGSILFIDIDHFKNVNDLLGHHIGDKLLVDVAVRISETMSDHGMVARLGGDEFVLLLPATAVSESAMAQQTMELAQQVRHHIAAPFNIDGHMITLGCTAGIALFPYQGADVNDLLRHADMAMYHGKESGRNGIHLFSREMEQKLHERHITQQMLNGAMEEGQLQLYYQPRFDDKNHLVGAESLIRWHHPELGEIPPDKFVTEAEESGQIIELGHWILRTVFRQLAQWQENGLPTNFTTLSINVSPKQFHQADFADEVLRLLQQEGAEPSLIELEITEGILVSRMEDTINKMEKLRDYGIRFSIDDFGTGYSSLAYLHCLPINCLKIDKSFISGIETDSSEATIVTTIIAMADNLGLELVAEGVETQAELEFLMARGCNVYQGYYFSEALTRPEFESLLSD